MRVICYTNQPPDGWDERLYAAGSEAGLCQSTYRARVIQQVDRAVPLFLEVHDDKEIVASLMLLQKVPWNRDTERRERGIRELIFGTLRGWLEWADGPVLCHDRAKAKEALDTLLAWIEAYANKRRLHVIRSQGWAHTSRWVTDEDMAQIFAKHGYKRNSWATFLVDLTPGEEEIWKKLSKDRARYEVRKARKLGVRIRTIRSFEEFKTKYYSTFRGVRTVKGLESTNPLPAFRVSWDEDREGYYDYYISESAEGEVLSTLGMYVFNGVATPIASSLTPYAIEQKIPANDLLFWEMFLEAKRLGCYTFDMAGANPNPTDPKEKGIRRFKEKWGGRYVEYNLFEKGVPSIAYSLEKLGSRGYRMVKAVRRYVRKR